MMKTAGATKEIGIVLYPGVQAACVHGLTDLFGIAAGIASDQRRDSRAALRVTHWQPAHSRDARLSCVYDSDPRVSPQPRILIIPPTMMDLPDPDVPAGVVSWLRSRHEDGAKLVAVCSGAFILAATRLAAGRSVSTHRICAEALAKRFPEISVDTNERIIDHGDIISAGGFMAWVAPCVCMPRSRTDGRFHILADDFKHESLGKQAPTQSLPQNRKSCRLSITRATSTQVVPRRSRSTFPPRWA
jgi:transcriptional regulator GlxA family with amidase domain